MVSVNRIVYQFTVYGRYVEEGLPVIFAVDHAGRVLHYNYTIAVQ
jgi:hypothetical protein